MLYGCVCVFSLAVFFGKKKKNDSCTLPKPVFGVLKSGALLKNKYPPWKQLCFLCLTSGFFHNESFTCAPCKMFPCAIV